MSDSTPRNGKEVHVLRLGYANSYLLRGSSGWLLIDAGIAGQASKFRRKLDKIGIRAEEIRLIVITHAHYDHVGSLAPIKSMCGCPVIAHKDDAAIIAKGEIVIPPGTNRITRPLCAFADRHPDLMKKFYGFEPLTPEISLTEELPLEPYGFSARIVPTPGHTSGSISVITDDGLAFVGDIAFNIPLLSFSSKAPPFGDSLDRVYQSWEKLLRLNVKRIYPSHGKSFGPEKLIRVQP